jgi:hypothetical protein
VMHTLFLKNDAAIREDFEFWLQIENQTNPKSVNVLDMKIYSSKKVLS